MDLIRWHNTHLTSENREMEIEGKHIKSKFINISISITRKITSRKHIKFIERRKLYCNKCQILSPPAMDHVVIPIFEPPEAFPERPFDISLHRVDFIASNSPLPLELRVIQAPRF